MFFHCAEISNGKHIRIGLIGWAQIAKWHSVLFDCGAIADAELAAAGKIDEKGRRIWVKRLLPYRPVQKRTNEIVGRRNVVKKSGLDGSRNEVTNLIRNTFPVPDENIKLLQP